MTQLNLSGKQSSNTQQKPTAEHEDESIKNQTVGALGALAMFAAVIVIGSCSSSKPVAVQQPLKPEAPASAPAVTTPAPVTSPTPVAAKTKTRRGATLSYVNREYGLALNFPRNYRLKMQPKIDADAAQMNFVQPGGLALAAIELPGNSYPGTDFKSGIVSVSVNPGMTSEACAQFAFPEPSTGTETSPVTIDLVKFGAIEFHTVQDSARAMMKESDAKYYHAFDNGACYEFALSVGTDDGTAEKTTTVDRQEVFAKLEKILATVKLRPTVAPETQMPVAQTQTSSSQTSETQMSAPAAAVTAPSGSSTTPENTSAHGPEKNQEPEKGEPVPNF
jgi:hypothetical protein